MRIAGVLSILKSYFKHKGMETLVIQLLNFIVPLAPLFAELGVDIITEVLPALLQSYGVEPEQVTDL